MKRWTWLFALMLALMIPLQGCTSNPPKDEGEEQNQQEQQKEEQEKDEEEKPEEDKEPEDTQAPADEQEDKDTDGDTPVSNQNQSNTSSEKPSNSTQKPQGGGSSSSQGSSNTSQGGGSKPSQGGGTQQQPQQPQQPQEPQQPEEKPQPALTASQVVSNLLSQHSMGDLTDYNGMVSTLYGGIDLSQMESYCVKGPAMGTTASEIAVFQVKAGGSTASVEKALRQRVDDVARTFEQYDPAQYEIAKKAVVRTKGNYMCMVIGSNASAIASSFEKMV